jgi:hypothetical protein
MVDQAVTVPKIFAATPPRGEMSIIPVNVGTGCSRQLRAEVSRNEVPDHTSLQVVGPIEVSAV